ncbi:GMC oxidoreductase [Fretibacter rubidus]|uniref:GMC oxidoreductase n=1 Tax=Fretibacter rubidus TaxID=570162 RepID=UPI00352B01E0
MDFDAIVIGSGISGGWVAKELCERGLKVCVLERGSEFDPMRDMSDNLDPWETPFADRVSEAEIEEDYPIQGRTYAFKDSTKHLWIKDSEHPYVRTDGTTFNWRRGGKVGGKSHMWARASYRLAPYDFAVNAEDGEGVDWPVRYDDIAPWYDYVEKFAGISGGRDGLAQLPDGKHFLPPFDLTCAEKDLQKSLSQLYPERSLIIGRVANLTRATDDHTAVGRGQCQARNRCYHGCSYGGYFSSTSATLPAAKATGKLTLIPNAIVSKLILDPKSQRISAVQVRDTKTGLGTTYRSNIVFLNASAIASAMILLNSASEDRPTGLANRSDQVGRNLMDHLGGSRVQARVPGHLDKYYYGRRPIGGYIPRYRNFPARDQDYKRGWGYQVYSSRGGGTGRRPGVGDEFKTANRTPGDWTIMLDAFGEVLPRADNRVTLHKTKTDKWGHPIANINFQLSENDKVLMQAAHNDAIEMLRAAGFDNIIENQKPGTDMKGVNGRIHEMGTARMGRDPSTSVLNKLNQAHDIANLFITDGSFMASSAVQNPSLSYMAFSARAAHHAADLLEAGVL